MSDDRTEVATEKRRSEARMQGQVLKSADFDAVVALGAGLVFLLLAGPMVAGGLAELVAQNLSEVGRVSGVRQAEPALAWLGSSRIALPVLGLALGSALLLVFVQVAQVGLVVSDETLTLNPERLSPLAGVKRMVSPQRIFTTATAIAKTSVIVAFVWLAVRDLLSHPVFTRAVSLPELGGFLVAVVWEVGWRVLLALAVIAAADYLFQRWRFERDLRMTKQEVKDEFKQTEGATDVKKRIRLLGRRRLFKSMRRMLEDMQDATIVITNPTHYAVALRYVRGETPAPVVLAKGIRQNALRIRTRAAELGLLVVEDKPVARGLYQHARVGDPIPVLYFQAVATLLAALYRRGLRPAPPPRPPPPESP